MNRTITVVHAGLGTPSSTRLLADRLSAAVARDLEGRGETVDVRLVELRDHAHALADAMLTGFASESLQAALDDVAGADGVVVVTPVFSASYSGLFKSFFDVLDREALRGTPVLAAATGGTARHSLVVDHALRPLLAYLRAAVVPTGVFAATEDFGGTGSAGLAERVDRAAGELAEAVVARLPKEGPRDAFELTTTFDQLLAGR
ncbi:FMN reductase [Thalassiella azotivora]